jgi:hypothetical protein
LIPEPAVDDETGEYIEQEYEVIQQGGTIVTRFDGIGEHLTPHSRMVARIHAAWENGILPAPGGLFRQPARAIRSIEYYSGACHRSAERFRTRGKVLA